MKKLLPILLLAVFSCHKDELTLRPFEFGGISFEMSAPKLNGSTSKVPSCKNIEPNEVRYNLTNSKGEPYTYTAALELSGNNYVSTPSNTLPFGNYVLNEVNLMNGNDTIYALPHQDELHLSPYWNTTLPMDITVAGTETVSGTVFCFNEAPAPDIDGIINGGFDPIRVQSLWFAVFDTNCITQITVEVNNYRYPEIFLWEELLYHVAVPLDYNLLTIRAYNGNNLVQSRFYDSANPYNPDGTMSEEDVVIFDYECP
tara:strand:- start:28134 stop:28904 length:771 start_codon:yes stop_codon:yes gene_type:complete